MTLLRPTLLLALLLAASPALATTVYLNGVAVDGLTNQKFTGAKVSFDEKGNVHIEAPGIEVKTLGAAPKPAESPLAVITKRYFVVPQQAATGMSGYDIDVFINGTWLKRFRGAEEENPLDITKHLVPGPNKILFTAKKQKGERKSFSPVHSFSMLIGEGTAGADQVVIDNSLLTFKRTAAETDDVTEEYTFTAR
jgi:hypothetical protein